MDSGSQRIIEAQFFVEAAKFLSPLGLGAIGFVSAAYWMVKTNGIPGETIYLAVSITGFFLCLTALFISMAFAMNKVSNRVSVYSSPGPILWMILGWASFLIGISSFLLFLLFQEFPPPA